uniref:Uncharacterized protein n=1 Tax=Nelumbo nucifera TaxID=4432 RepID=A0A822ZHX4_NELNU|nr:TPA_asm: hypothetical protein HUJ06_002707 [Nelumbo nucifera]DAD44478.1 TPA_asm: hypothetical protein HUJ06_002708 [Nelumbo nucifera]
MVCLCYEAYDYVVDASSHRPHSISIPSTLTIARISQKVSQNSVSKLKAF